MGYGEVWSGGGWKDKKDINTYGEFPECSDLRFKLNWGEMILHNNITGRE